MISFQVLKILYFVDQIVVKRTFSLPFPFLSFALNDGQQNAGTNEITIMNTKIFLFCHIKFIL